MFITKSIVHGYSSELANLTYDVEVGNGVKIQIKPADLLLFIKKYMPEFNDLVASFITPVLAYKQVQEANKLYHYIAYKLDTVMEPTFSFQLRELNFDFSTNSMEFDSFQEFVASGKIVEFFEVASNIIPSLRNDKPYLFEMAAFEPVSFVFHEDSLIYSSENYDIVIKKPIIEALVERISNDFNSMGEQTLTWLNSIEQKSYANYRPVNFVIDNFENDIVELKSKDLDYADFCMFLNKYKLTENS